MSARRSSQNAKRSPNVGGRDPIADVIKQCGLSKKGLMVLKIRLSSSAQFAKDYAEGIKGEKSRKRAVDKVRTNALRLLTAIDELDEDARVYLTYKMCGGSDDRPVKERRAGELRAISQGQLPQMLKQLRRIASVKGKKLPPQDLKVSPLLWIATDVCSALKDAKLDVVAADDSFAANCLRAVAAKAGIRTADGVRYWIDKALQDTEN